nr:hypothetical protein [Tanacetum cinerariifolium]
MRVHRTADVKQQQQLDGVTAFRPHLDVQQAGIACGVINRAVDVQLVGRPLTRELAQTPQSHFDVARAQFNPIIE